MTDSSPVITITQAVSQSCYKTSNGETIEERRNKFRILTAYSIVNQHVTIPMLLYFGLVTNIFNDFSFYNFKAKKTKEAPTLSSREDEDDDHDKPTTEPDIETLKATNAEHVDEGLPETSGCEDGSELSDKEKEGNTKHVPDPGEKEDHEESLNLPCTVDIVIGTENKHDIKHNNSDSPVQTTSVTSIQTDSFHSCTNNTSSPSSPDFALTEDGGNNVSREGGEEVTSTSIITQIKGLDLSLEEMSNPEISWPPDSPENQTEVKDRLSDDTPGVPDELPAVQDQTRVGLSVIPGVSGEDTRSEVSQSGAQEVPLAQDTTELDQASPVETTPAAIPQDNSKEMNATQHDERGSLSNVTTMCLDEYAGQFQLIFFLITCSCQMD